MSSSRLIQQIRNPPQPPTSILAFSKVGLCIIPITQVAIGAVHLNDCPLQRLIPIYLIVMGFFSLLLTVLSCLPCAREQNDGTSNLLGRVCTAWNSLISVFIFCWFIAGNAWIYRIYKPNYEKNATTEDLYCNKTLYLFAFWTTTLVYIFLGLFLVGGCCVLFCFFLCGRADADDEI